MQNNQTKKNKPVVLVVLDGWGIAPPSHGNAITLAKTPFFSTLISLYPTYTLEAAGLAVGLSWGEMGGSEVGHLNLGAGKVIYQTLPRINKAIEDGSFFKNSAFLKAIEQARKYNSKIHLVGLVSNGNVHASIDHLKAILDLMKRENFKRVFLQAILDGRDTPYNSGLIFIKEILKEMEKNNLGGIATLAGRFYSMDRDGNWERIEKSYLAMTEGVGEKSSDPIKAIEESYKKNIFDEEFIPTVILKNNEPVAKVEDNDAVIFFNFRTERARELTKAFVLDDFKGFNRKRKIKNLFFVTMTEYEKGLPTEVAFPPETIEYPLARILSEHGLKQLHIAETEKYAHVTYFFNGGREKPYPNEDWVLVPSPKVSSFDQKPEMSAKEITQNVISAINKDKYDFILINFANPDIVGHTGNLQAVISAIELLDKLLSKIVEATLSKNGVVIITADHGNAEEIINLRTGEIDKEHSNNPVPFILVGKEWEKKEKEEVDLSTLSPVGILADVAPTILKIMGIPQPKEMNGKPLI